jgi:hypothetical protein
VCAVAWPRRVSRQLLPSEPLGTFALESGYDDIGDGTLDRAIRATAQETEEHRARLLSP